MRKIPKEAEGVSLTASQKITNFWYYNKWFCLFFAILFIIIGISLYSCTHKTNYDCTVVLALSTELTDTSIEKLTEQLLPYCEDYNGDGEVNLNVYNCSFLESDVYSQTSHYTNFVTCFQEAENMIIIIDEPKIDFVGDDLFMDSTLNLPDLNGKAILLNKTDFGKNCKKECGFELPENTYMVRRDFSGSITKKKNSEYHFNNAEKFIKNFLNQQVK